MSCSVIICAYTLNRWSDLLASVDSVRCQTVVPSQLIVVIDHNTELLARAQEALHDVTVVPSEQSPGLSGARNTGLAHATSEIVAFIDDDATARETWLEELVAAYSADSILGVGGLIVPMWEHERPGWLPEEFDWVVGCTYLGMPEGARVRNLIGANMSFRRDVLVAIGGFNSWLGRTSTEALAGEEADVCIRAARENPGGVFVYASRALVDHHVPDSRATSRYFRERCYGEGISKARLSQALGSRDGLASERHHVLVTLPAGVARNVRAFLGGDRAGLARAAAIVAGLGFTGAGYVAGRLAARAKPEAAANLTAPVSQATPRPRVRPRVLMVTPRFAPLVGGVELHVAQVARLLRAHVDVTVLTTDTTGELPASEVLDGVTVLRVPAWPRKRDYYFAPQIRQVIADGKWDLIHVQSYHSAVAPMAMLAALRARIPYVLTFHGGGHSSRVRNALRHVQWQVLRPLLARARKLIAVAEFEAEQFSSVLRLPRERFVVIPNGSDMSAFPVQPERRRPGIRPTILSVGRLERYKGHQRVIEAMPGVLAKLPGSTLHVIGSGPYQPELERLVERLGLNDKVTIRAISPDDRQAMAQALVWSSLIVLMSEFETHPLSIIEALELGRPTLVADTSGLREIAQHGSARAIPLDSTPDELAAAIVEELSRPHSESKVPAGTWEECADKLLALYVEVLAPLQSMPAAGLAADGRVE